MCINLSGFLKNRNKLSSAWNMSCARNLGGNGNICEWKHADSSCPDSPRCFAHAVVDTDTYSAQAWLLISVWLHDKFEHLHMFLCEQMNISSYTHIVDFAWACACYRFGLSLDARGRGVDLVSRMFMTVLVGCMQ